MTYSGPIRAVILDWAGTVVDFGSRAPVEAFIETFRRTGVEITVAEARAPMGSAKRDHIAAILAMPEVRERWRNTLGAHPIEADVERIYAGFIPIQLEAIVKFAHLIPGTTEAMADFRRRGLKVGTTTGYTGMMMDQLIPLAAERGFSPDFVVAADDVPASRPAPWMCFANMVGMGVYPPAACVKIGDTIPDIEEGLNAGMWTIGVSASGNEVGLSLEEAKALPEPELYDRIEAANQKLIAAGAHYTITDISEAPLILDSITERLAVGEAP